MEPCPRCGADRWRPERAGFWRAVGEWLQQGGRFRPTRHRCEGCGTVMGVSRGMSLRSAHWWGAPWRVLQVFRRRRRAVPVPSTYLWSALVGTVLGVALDLLLGWQWWLVVLGFLAVVWLVFMATSLGSGVGSPFGLTRDLLAAVSSRRAWTLQRRREEAMFRAPPFPVYGLDPSWVGERSLGGWGAKERAITELSLHHGRPDRGVTVISTVPGRGEPFSYVAAVFLENRMRAWQRQGEPPRVPPRRGLRIPVAVEGEPVEFEGFAEGDDWIGRARVGAVDVTVECRGVGPAEVRLTRITDIEPYIRGSRRLAEELEHEHEHGH